MNVSELARRLRVGPKELQVLLPKLGIDIGTRAVKIDDHAARKLIREWPMLIKRLEQEAAAAVKAQEIANPGVVKEARLISLPSHITVRDLATTLQVPVARLMQELIKQGILANVNEVLDFETASIVGEDFGVKASRIKETKAQEEEHAPHVLPPREGISVVRPPVVVVMGHVDHGKTQLLDAIRHTKVMEGEAGGITQHIGAYQVEKNGRMITFLDTPGHEAFVAMRSRGAKVADVAILVVAADDGVQPQTLEALRIIKAGKVPLVVAINKMDKADADSDKVKRQLSDAGLVPEGWGGNTVCVGVSAKLGTGIDALLDTVLLVADLEKDRLVAVSYGPAVGTVIESHRDQGEGIVATLLVQGGALRRSDTLALGDLFYGKVKAMKDFMGREVKEALPSQPVKILGFKLLPAVGAVLEVKEEDTLVRKRAPDTVVRQTVEHTDVVPTLLLSVKADVAGSLEALLHELEKFQHKEVALKVVEKAFGNVRESDVMRAKAQSARVIGFHVEIEPDAQKAALQENVPLFVSPIIYEVLAEVQKNMEVLLPPRVKEVKQGSASVVKVFRRDGGLTIVGVRVQEGNLEAGLKFHILRRSKMVGGGELKELRSGSETTSRAVAGQEVGIKVKASSPLIEGDTLAIYQEEQEARTLFEDQKK